MKRDMPDFDSLWDYSDPSGTQEKFSELLVIAETSSVIGYRAELLTQIARTQGLQRKYDEAHKTLDKVEGLLTSKAPRARVRYFLERGRVFNSSGNADQAKPYFLEAWDLGKKIKEDGLAVDAAHMVAITEKDDAAMAWNLKALALAEKSTDESARKWRGSLYNNVGWTYHDQGEFTKALDMFQKALAFREEQGDAVTTRIARWCVARALRSLNKIDQALTIQRDLHGSLRKLGISDGFVSEEIGECWLALGRPDEASPYFAEAYEILRKDEWLVKAEPARIERLKELAED